MSIVEKIEKHLNEKNQLSHIDDLLKRLERFDGVKPNETIWSEQRLLDTVRTHIQIENNV